jgi:hypothetical protein
MPNVLPPPKKNHRKNINSHSKTTPMIDDEKVSSRDPQQKYLQFMGLLANLFPAQSYTCKWGRPGFDVGCKARGACRGGN